MRLISLARCTAHPRGALGALPHMAAGRPSAPFGGPSAQRAARGLPLTSPPVRHGGARRGGRRSRPAGGAPPPQNGCRAAAFPVGWRGRALAPRALVVSELRAREMRQGAGDRQVTVLPPAPPPPGSARLRPSAAWLPVLPSSARFPGMFLGLFVFVAAPRDGRNRGRPGRRSRELFRGAPRSAAVIFRHGGGAVPALRWEGVH